LGVPAAAIGVEQRSRNTRENAREARAALAPADIHEIVLVSSAWHLPRAVHEFERVGFTVHPVDADYRSSAVERGLQNWLPEAEALATTQLMWKEYLGRAWLGLEDAGD
jgi:uncharacterized SAM-binding protein YcdF (DUF218 family)